MLSSQGDSRSRNLESVRLNTNISDNSTVVEKNEKGFAIGMDKLSPITNQVADQYKPRQTGPILQVDEMTRDTRETRVHTFLQGTKQSTFMRASGQNASSELHTISQSNKYGEAVSTQGGVDSKLRS